MRGLSQLSARERVLLLGGGALLLALAGWLYLWQPLLAARANQAERIGHYLSVLALADRAGAAPLTATESPESAAPLAQRVTRSGEAAGIPLARLDPEGVRLRITVAEAGFAELIGWIAELEAAAGVRALSVEIARLTEPGRVSLRMTVEEAR
jgi:general secretion pathway protein M